jgi:hypothetical protein
MRVLVACEYSGTVRDSFIRAGHYAASCDLLPSDSPLGDHYQCNVLDILDHDWDLLIAHPPCTYLTNSGVCWLHRDPDRWRLLDEAADFFRALLECPIPLKCIENPIQHKYAKERIGRTQNQVIQPWMFGHMEQKATCLWLEGLPLLQPTNDVKAQMMLLPKRERERLHYLPPSEDRWKLRSTTYKGIAEAMAAQWGVKQPQLALL